MLQTAGFVFVAIRIGGRPVWVMEGYLFFSPSSLLSF